jgi:Ran GTPase-activating protein (RanGAP) involved in mRNA processing and transport
LAALKPLAKLERIELFRTRAGNASAEALASMKSLRIVKMDYTAMDDKGLALLQALPGLAELSIDNTNVTDASVGALKSMAALRSLNLYHTLISEKGYGELNAGLAGCKIVFDRDSALPNRRTR